MNTNNIILIFFSIISLLISVYLFFSQYHSKGYIVNLTNTIFVTSIFLFFSSIFFVFIIKLNEKIKQQFLIIFISSLIGIYSFEFFLSYKNNKIIFQKGTKNKYEIVREMQQNNHDAYLNIAPHLFIKSNGLDTDGRKLYPLGSISNSFIVMNNELGFYPIYKTDLYGFNNDNYRYENHIDNILIGDSFTEGCCVEQEHSISEVLNSLGQNSINFGKSGNGPLTEYATFLEYATKLKPKKILWLYYPNDFRNLKNELQSKILQSYLLDENFTQDLINRQDEINIELIKYLKLQEKNYKSKIRDENIDVFFKNHWLIKIVKLTNIRLRFSLININNDISKKNYQKETLVLLDILKKTKIYTEGWGGKLIFIYIPSIIQMNNEARVNFHYELFEKINEIDIQIIDLKKILFDNYPNPTSLLSNDSGGHFNRIGYKLVAEKIYESIQN